MDYVRRMRPLLGTYVEINVENCAAALVAIEAAYQSIQNIQSLLSFHDTNSDLSRLNLANGQWVQLHKTSLRVLKLAKVVGLKSHGLFNCTVGGALVKQGALPDHGGDFIACGAASDIEICGNATRLLRPVRITLDGIAKGYAVDMAIVILKSHGIARAWINAGGDMRSYGDVVVPVHRRELGGEMSALGGLQNAALATSHQTDVFDPNLPAMLVGQSTKKNAVWSVLARSAWRADALTKVAAFASDDVRESLLARLGGKIVYPQHSN